MCQWLVHTKQNARVSFRTNRFLHFVIFTSSAARISLCVCTEWTAGYLLCCNATKRREQYHSYLSLRWQLGALNSIQGADPGSKLTSSDLRLDIVIVVRRPHPLRFRYLYQIATQSIMSCAPSARVFQGLWNSWRILCKYCWHWSFVNVDGSGNTASGASNLWSVLMSPSVLLYLWSRAYSIATKWA